jgi:glycosyltransferase involved in cell wall biosynthesis
MKVVQLSTSDMGGAGIAAKNLHLALLEKKIESSFVSKMAVGDNFERRFILNPEKKSFIANAIHRLSSRFSCFDNDAERYYLSGRSKEFEYFSLPWSELEPEKDPVISSADIIHLHWIADRFIDYKKIFALKNKRFVWTLHDMNPFTGGCHHSDGSMKFEADCNYCHQLKGTRDEYLSGKIHRYKSEALKEIKNDQLIIVTPSQWLGQLSKRSSLFKRFQHEVIPNCIHMPQDVVDRIALRKKHGIKEDEILFLFVAHHFDNPRKGINTLLKAVEELNNDSIRLATVGQKSPDFKNNLKLKQFGFVTDPVMMKELYTIADVFLLPSKAENFPNTIVEALLCGTPVIASQVGGIPEQVNERNGLLAEPGNVEDWKNKIVQFLNNRKNYDRSEIKSAAESSFNNSEIAQENIDLYNHLIGI